MKLPSILTTSAVRLALRYVLACALVLALAAAALWWSMGWFADAGLEAGLRQDFQALQRVGTTPAARITAIEGHLQEQGKERHFYLLVSADGGKLAGNLLLWPPDSDIPLDGELHRVWLDEDAFPPGLYTEEPYLPGLATRFPDGSRLLLAGSVGQAGHLRSLTEYLAQVLSAAAVLALALGIMIGRAILQRMDAIARTASEIMAGDLSRRVPVSGCGDEFDALAERLNAMLERVQQLVRGLREVTDNVAHDLRRPLARLRNRLEVTLLEPRSAEEYRLALQQGSEDADSLMKTFNALLGIAQAEAGNHRGEWGPVNLNDLSHDLAELYGAAAEEKQQRLELEIAEGVCVTGSRDLLAQALGNLLENAIKYTPDGGTLRLQLHELPDAVELVVSDSGPGIPEAERAHVLERFVRLEAARDTAGNGLGLSLVRAVANLHGAELQLGDARPGLRVSLRFPCHPVMSAKAGGQDRGG